MRALWAAGTGRGVGQAAVAIGAIGPSDGRPRFANKNRRIEGFKVGPDFIEPGLGARAADRHLFIIKC